MSKKEFNSMIDFQLILDELEKISYENPDSGLNLSKSNLAFQFASLKQEAAKEAEEDLNNIFKRAAHRNVETLDGIPEPLTQIESEAFDSKYDETLNNIKVLKEKVAFAKEIIRERIEKEQGYDLDLANRRDTKRAAKNFFKKKKDFISYEDYILARDYKNSQSEKEVNSFMKDED